MKIVFAFTLLFLSWHAYANEYSIKTIEIQHRPAQEIAQVLTPLISEGGSIQVYKNTLIIKAKETQVHQLLTVIEKLDQKLQTLIVTVSLGQDKPRQSFTVNAQGELVENGATLGGSTVIETSREDKRSIHHIRMLSGDTAHIESGMSVPIVLYDSYLGRQASSRDRFSRQSLGSENEFSTQVPAEAGTRVNQPSLILQDENNPLVKVPPLESTENGDETALIESEASEGVIQFELKSKEAESNTARSRDYDSRLQGSSRGYEQKVLRSGMYVTPTLRQDSVYLDILTVDERPHDEYRQRPAKNQPSFYYQKTESSLTIPLGQWVLISGNQRESINRDNTISTRDRRQDRSSVWIRVDTVKPN